MTRLVLTVAIAASLAAQTITTIQPTTIGTINTNFSNLNAGKLHLANPSTWASGTTYNQSDVVIYNGAMYISLQGSNSAQTPGSSPTYWQVIPGSGGGSAISGVAVNNPAAGTITISPSIDQYTNVNVTMTSAGRNLILPAPATNTLQAVTVTNVGSAATPNYSFTMGGSNIQPGTSILAIWVAASSTWQFLNPPTNDNTTYIVGAGCKSLDHSDTNCINSITAAYNDALAAGLASVKIIDQTLTFNTATTEVLNNTPWQFGGGEIPVDLELGPGILVMNGPFTVGRNSHVHGFSRSLVNLTGGGAIIQATDTGCNGNKDSASCYYGGIYTATVTGGTTCQVNDKFNVVDAAGHGTGAILQVATLSGGNPATFNAYNLGGGYGASTSWTLTNNGTVHCAAAGLTVTGVTKTITGAYVGDQWTGGASIFNSRLTKVTLNGNDINCYSGFEVQNAQEQSIIDEVNVNSWGGYACPSNITGGGYVHGGWVFGRGSNNFMLGNVEINGCTTGDTLCKVSYNNKQLTIENTYVMGPLKVTHNPNNVVTSPAITGATCSAGTPNLVTLTFTSTLQSQFGPVGGPYAGGINVSGMTPSGYNGMYAISSIPSTTSLIYALPNGVACPGLFSAGGTAVPLPAYGITVCSGSSGCDDNQAPVGDTVIPTTAAFTLAHCEHTDTCLTVTGTKTSVTDIAPVSSVGTSSRIGTHIVGACGSNPASYTAFNLTSNGSLPTNNTIVDDCAPLGSTQIATKQDSTVAYYHTGTASIFEGGVNAQSTTYTVLPGDCSKLVAFTGLINTTFTLTPINSSSSSTMGYGCTIRFSNVGTATLTIQGGGGNLIDASNTMTVSAGGYASIRSDGTIWRSVYNTTAGGGGSGNVTAGASLLNLAVPQGNGSTGIATPAVAPTYNSSTGDFTLNGATSAIIAPGGLQIPSKAALMQGLTGVAATPPSSQEAAYFDPTSGQLTVKDSTPHILGSTVTIPTSLNYVAGGGSAQAQTVTYPGYIPSLAAGLNVCWMPIAPNSGAAPTLAVNGLTATIITKLGTAALVANDLTSTAVACAVYDGTQFELQNPQTSGGGGSTVTEEIQDVLGSCLGGVFSSASNWSSSAVAASQCNSSLAGVAFGPLISFATGSTLTRSFTIPTGLSSLEVYAELFPTTTVAGTSQLSAAITCVAAGSTFNTGSFNTATNSTAQSNVLNTIQAHDMASVLTSGCSAGNQAFLKVTVTTGSSAVYFMSAPVIRMVRTLP